MNSDLIIHYFLNDPTIHQMNAKLANKNQANIIDIIENFAMKLGITIELDVVAAKEGGFKDILRLKPKTTADRWISGVAFIAIQVIIQVTGTFLTQDTELNTLQKEYYKAQLHKDHLDEKQTEIEQLLCCVDKLDFNGTDIKIKEKRSSIYEQLNNDKNISCISIETQNMNGQITTIGTVEKKDFCKFIIGNPQRKIEIDENATIIIIAPVLNGSKFQWKGDYNNQVIDFSMTDSDFKKDILSKNITFGNNDVLSGCLEIKKKINEQGEVVSTKYTLRTVYETEHMGGVYQTKKGYQKIEDKRQMCFFDNGDNK